jgi:4-hydroxyphenylacetate 3-monooxygenase
MLDTSTEGVLGVDEVAGHRSDVSTQQDWSRSQVSDRVRAILPILASRARETESERQMLPETLDLLREIGWWRAIVPAMYGGLENDLYDWIRAVRLMSSVDMSTGWTAGLLGCHTHGLAHFPKRVQDEIWGSDPDAIIASVGPPSPTHKNEIRRVDDGFIVTSRHGFSSGSGFADWAVATLPTIDEKTSRVTSYRCVVPRGDFEVDDTWFVSGMKGTGSRDVIFNESFVPDYRCLKMDFGAEEPAPRIHSNPLYGLSFVSVYNLPFGAFMVGGMEGALQVAEDAMTKRARASLSGRTTVEHLPSQLRLAECKMEAFAASLVAEARWKDLCDVVANGRLDTIEEFKIWRAQDAFVAQVAVKVVDRLMAHAGPSANHEAYPLQRFWRDLHVGSQHPYIEADGAYQVYARQILGLPRDLTLRFS